MKRGGDVIRNRARSDNSPYEVRFSLSVEAVEFLRHRRSQKSHVRPNGGANMGHRRYSIVISCSVILLTYLSFARIRAELSPSAHEKRYSDLRILLRLFWDDVRVCLVPASALGKGGTSERCVDRRSRVCSSRRRHDLHVSEESSAASLGSTVFHHPLPN